MERQIPISRQDLLEKIYDVVDSIRGPGASASMDLCFMLEKTEASPYSNWWLGKSPPKDIRPAIEELRRKYILDE